MEKKYLIFEITRQNIASYHPVINIQLWTGNIEFHTFEEGVNYLNEHPEEFEQDKMYIVEAVFVKIKEI